MSSVRLCVSSVTLSLCLGGWARTRLRSLCRRVRAHPSVKRGQKSRERSEYQALDRYVESLLTPLMVKGFDKDLAVFDCLFNFLSSQASGGRE